MLLHPSPKILALWSRPNIIGWIVKVIQVTIVRMALDFVTAVMLIQGWQMQGQCQNQSEKFWPQGQG